MKHFMYFLISENSPTLGANFQSKYCYCFKQINSIFAQTFIYLFVLQNLNETLLGAKSDEVCLFTNLLNSNVIANINVFLLMFITSFLW